MKLYIGEAGSNFNSEQSALCLQLCPCDAFWGTRLSNMDYLCSACCIQALGQQPAAQKRRRRPPALVELTVSSGELQTLILQEQGEPRGPSHCGGLGFPGWVSYSVPVLRTTPVSAYKA